MSSGAVAASDPGGGETKLVAGADVTMSEAAGEAPALDADVKVEGKATLAMDVAHEGVDVAVSDPLYATESAGMVGDEGPGDEPVNGAEGVNGEDGGEEGRLEAGAEVLLTEKERKPVLAVDVAAAAAGGSATPEHAEDESNKLEENHVSAEPGGENNESDNGIAHSYNEIQNNVPSDIAGSSKEHESDVAHAVDQPNNASEMLPQTSEQFADSGNGLDSNLEAASLGNVDQGARYCLPSLDKDGFHVADLVWGKVKSHPWWPGEIFDPSDASELALKHQKKGSHLVAYFGDNTFAWCDESQLKPFVTNYSQMEKQSSSDAFVGSVNNALEELSRRILSGMSCSCLPEELADNGMSYMVDNAGLKDGVTCSAVNRPEIINCFSPENLLHYIKELALFPGQGGDLLELVIACSQLTSFYRSKGCPELASFQTGDAWVEEELDGMDTSSTQNVVVEEPVINEVQPTQDKPKRGRGRPRKHKPGDDQVVMEKRNTSNQVNDTSYDEKQVGMDFDDFDNLQNKKKRNFDSFEDSDKSSAPTGGSSFKIGECIRRAASQLTGSTSIMKAQNEPTAYKNAAEGENGEFDISSDDAGDELTVEKRAKRRRLYRNHTADPKELLSQLCLVATEPMNGCSFSAMLISYFNDYRNYIVSTTTEANIIDKGTSRRGRKRKEVLPSPEVETTDHMQDSYWSGLSLHNHPIHDLRKESPTARPRRRRRSSRHAYVPLSELGDPVPKKQIQVKERSIIHVDEKMIDELKPTALVLSFGRSATIPSELDLVKMFIRYGPLKETETEVHKETNTVKVVFKKRADAERAFSVAGKYGTFGPSLRSYRLVNMPFSLETLSANNAVKHPEDRGTKNPGSSKSEVPKDPMEVDPVQKTDKVEFAGEPSFEEAESVKQTSQVEDKVEFVGEPSFEEAETVKQTSQVEAADGALVSQVDRVEKAGKIDTELIGHINQIGKDVQAASVPEGSSQQVGNIEQVYTQNEASISGLPAEAETLHSDALIEELPENVPDNMQTDVVAEAPKQSHISGDNAVIEAVTEAPSTAQVHTEDGSGIEVPEEHKVSHELQGQTSGEELVRQTATEEKVGPEGPMAQAENFAANVQGSVEQVEVEVESKTNVEVSGEQGHSTEQTVEVEAVIEASGGQLELGKQVSEDESMADATTEESTVMAEETLEAKVVPIKVNIENNNAAAVGVVEGTSEGETKEEAPDEKGKIENKEDADKLAGETREGQITIRALDQKIENKADADTLAGETREGEITVEAPDEKTANKAIAEPVSGETETTEGQATAGALVEAGTGEGMVEDVRLLDDKSTAAEKPAEDATVVTHENSTTVEKTLGDAIVAPPGTDTTNAEKTAVGATAVDEDAPAVKTIEDTSVEAPDVQDGASGLLQDGASE